MDVSKNIRAARERLNLTQVDVAKRLGTERSNYARLENRGSNLTVKQLEDIANVLGVPISDLMGITETAEPGLDQSSIINRMEGQIKALEEILKSKDRDIKFYRRVFEWIRSKFLDEFLFNKLVAADIEVIEEEVGSEINSHELRFDKLSDEELRKVGDTMFESEVGLVLISEFLASSGFITDKWFIDAYKRVSRKQGHKVSPSEAINFIQGALALIGEEN